MLKVNNYSKTRIPKPYEPPRATIKGAEPVDILKHDGTDAKWGSGLRPVDVAFDGCGRLVVTSDGTRPNRWSAHKGGMVVRISYSGARQPCPGGPTSSSPKTTKALDAGNTATNQQRTH